MKSMSLFKTELESQGDDERFATWMRLFTSEDPQAKQQITRIILGSDPVLKIMFCRFLAHVPQKKAVTFLMLMLFGGNDYVVENAAKALDRNTYEDKTTFLIPVLQSPNRKARYYAIDRLATTATSDVTGYFLGMLTGADKELTLKLLTGLRLLADTRVLNPIQPLLNHKDEDIRLGAVLILGTLYQKGFSAARRRLVGKLTDPAPKIRKAVIWHLRAHPKRRDVKIYLDRSTADPDASVKQECLMALSHFPRVRVIRHLVRILVTEKNRMVTLRAKAALYSIPTRKILPGLKRLLSDSDTKIRYKAMLLYAAFQKKSPAYYRYLKRELLAARTDKEKIPIIESLGELESPLAIPLLEAHLHDSPLVRYAGMTALVRLWGFDPDFPVLKYLAERRLSDLERQIVLRHFNKFARPEMYSKELVDRLTGLLESKNLNIRYLSTLALVKVINESLLRPVFDQLLQGTDPMAFKLTRESLVNRLQREPPLLVSLFQKYVNNKKAVDLLFSLLTEIHFTGDKLVSLLSQILGEPVYLLRTNHVPRAMDLILEAILKNRFTVTELFNSLKEAAVQRELMVLFLERVKKEPGLRLKMPLKSLRRLLKDEAAIPRDLVVALMGYSDSEKVVPLLVSTILAEKNQRLRERAVEALNRFVQGSNYA